MNANVIQTAVSPLPLAGSAGQDSGISSASSSSTGPTFADQLDHALNKGNAPNVPEAKAAKPERSTPRAATQVALAQAPNPTTNASGAPGTPAAPSPVSTPTSASAAPSQPDATATAASATQIQSQNPSQPQAGATVSARLLWLTEMIPFAAYVQDNSTSAGSGNAQTAATPQGQGKDAAGNTATSPGAVKDLAAAGSTASQGAGAKQAESASSQSSNQSPNGTQPASAGGSSSLSPQASSASMPATPDDAQMQRAIRSLENIGLSLASTSTAANGVPLPAASGKGAPPSTTAALNGAVHAPQPKTDNSAQSAERDANAIGIGATSSGSGHGDYSNAVKPASASDGSKNGNGQDSQQGKQSNAQPGSAVNEGGISTAAAAANQAASNNFGAVLNQAGQPGGTSGAQGSSAVTSSSATSAQAAQQPTVAEKVATAMQNPVNATGGVVSGASLVENQGKTEMRVALQTDTMGTLQLHAVLDGGRVGASISVVSHEAHTLLTNELPSLQQALTDQNVRLDHLTVINTPMASGGGTGDYRGFQSADYNQQRDQSAAWLSGGSVAAPAAASREPITHEDIRRRLSVRA
ncbi:MAG TPA: flagellar hook-length control protein FliK [Terriglobia bacterium]|nr:flagellar hook-length control protein FliK [Terriglobia bacterium]